MTPRILLVAEPFGFGPAAALALIARELAPYAQLELYARAHTAQLFEARDSGVTRIHRHPELAALPLLAREFDAVLIAMDWEAAEVLARDPLAPPRIFLDALAWFWRELPPAASSLSLTLMQDFPGTKAAAAQWPSLAAVIPPLVSPVPAPELSARTGLGHVSLGGLANPLLPMADVLTYAGAVHGAAEHAELTLSWVGSRALNERIPSLATLDPAASLRAFAAAPAALITPGLGNVFDAAAAGTPALLLPPANDSQGQQARLLRAEGWADAFVDWHELLGGEPLDYTAPQPLVMARIRECIQRFAASPTGQLELGARCQEFLARPPLLPAGARALTELGHSGAPAAARQVLAHLAQLAELVTAGGSPRNR